MTTIEHEFLTIAEAAELLRVSKASIRRAIAAGQIPVVRIGPRNLRIRRDALSPRPGPRAPLAPAPRSEWARNMEERLLRGGLTEEELMACIEEINDHILAERGGIPLDDSLPYLHAARDERDEYLANL